MHIEQKRIINQTFEPSNFGTNSDLFLICFSPKTVRVGAITKISDPDA